MPPETGKKILDHWLITERYFFPRHDSPADIVKVDVGNAVLACHHHRPHPGAPTVIHFHGNGETVDDYVPWFPELWQQRGLNTFLAEYRGYGASTGTPLYGRMLDDTEAIFEAVGQPEDQIVVFGRSVGSTYALELVGRHPGVWGLIIESGIADPLERLLIRFRPEELGVTEQELARAAAERLDHRKKLAGFEGPLLVMHAADDSLLDVSNGERLAVWGPQGRTELLVFPSGDHNAIMLANMQEYWAAIDRLLAGVG
ncbi:MAG: alpha/beta hydrolase [Deltaproteobacteria bacterium]|nr:alpha/beta hydrolase [Deltaproteobacteria bacterium]